MLGFMFVTAFLSMWISNTATTAMMMPIVEAMLEQIVATHAALDTCQGTLELSDKAKAGEFPGTRGLSTAVAFPAVAGCYGCFLSPGLPVPFPKRA